MEEIGVHMMQNILWQLLCLVFEFPTGLLGMTISSFAILHMQQQEKFQIPVCWQSNMQYQNPKNLVTNVSLHMKIKT